MQQPIEYSFAHLPDWIKISGLFADTCKLRIAPDSLNAGQTGALSLKIGTEGRKTVAEHVTLTFGAISGVFAMSFNFSHAKVDIGAECKGRLDCKLWRGAELRIGQKTTFNGARIVVDNGMVTIGTDCMFSDDILVQSSDQHGIIDARTLEVTNGARRDVMLDDHVWVGRRATIMPNVRIGFGAIIGAGAVVTADVPAMSVAAGVPARILRTDTTWSRNTQGLSPQERSMIKAFQDAPSP